MSRPANERFIIAVAASSVAAMLMLLVVSNTAIRVLLALPFMLALPGYAITVALFPRRALGIPERTLFSIGLSLAVVALGGLILNWTPWGLQADSWAVLLCATTCLASVMALARRRREVALAAAPAGLGLTGLQSLLLGLAAVVAVAAIGLARMPAPLQSAEGYTLLWMLPSADGNPNAVRLGVDSMELASTQFRLEVKADSRTLREWPSLTLMPGEKWERRIELPAAEYGAGTIDAALYRLDDPRSVYRQVTLRRSESP